MTVNEPTIPQTRNPQTIITAQTFQSVEIRIVELVEIGYHTDITLLTTTLI